ncbi:glutaredoxin [Gregarina niphandrodes]|uniref:Glutaredoxin n=1 Tax=Gregarina niphandrodes TaxID=110365 RepID=A0A023B8D5_GRENI|nr:glutaredoxin [Gregarina niphandrodes]EZG68991.1 glutaredoxin [Gregarina niphandrodes]|eukprot:XP_011134509.1 glutaredoxin [Gregarina niphandrodes]
MAESVCRVRSVFELADSVGQHGSLGVLFFAEGHAKSDAMKAVFEKLPKVAPQARYVMVEMKDIACSREALGVTAVPTFWVVVNQALPECLEVPQAPDYLALCKKYLVQGSVPLGQELFKDRAALDVLLKGARDAAVAASEEWLSVRPYVILTTDASKCRLLSGTPEPGRIVLDQSTAPEMAAALHTLFPTTANAATNATTAVTSDLVIVDGSLFADDSVDGLKKLQEASKELEEIATRADAKLAERCRDIINQAEVVMFMKGSKSAPYCKFSKAISALLREAEIDDYDCFNVFTDDYIREKVKVVSNWKTFPQLYVRGQLIGGIDTVKQMIEENGGDPKVLKKLLKL